MKARGRRTERNGIANAFSGSGYYRRQMAANHSLWGWSIVLALLCSFISYPGIWYSDSYVRVTTGGAVLNAIVKTLTGRRFMLDTGNAFTIIPSFFMAISQGLTGHVGLYTFAQAFAFFAAVLLLIRELNQKHWKLQGLIFALSPLIYGMSVYYEAGIGCVTGMICLILLLQKAEAEKSRRDRMIEFLLMAFASFVTFGYRTNALTIIPVLGIYLIRMRSERIRKALLVLALVVGLLFTKVLPWIFDIHSQSTASVGIVWEMLTVIQRMEPEKQAEYQDYLDDIGGEGSTREALRTSTDNTAGNFMWGEALGTGDLSAPGATMAALKKYGQLMIEQPLDWLHVKADVIRKAMGIGYTLDYSEYNYNRWDAMAEFGFNDSLQRQAFYDSFMSTVSFLGFYVLHPWMPFLVALLMLIAERILKREKRKGKGFVFWMAAFYYLAYLLDTPAYDFRYFYPSLLLLMILEAAITMEWIAAAASAIHDVHAKRNNRAR